MKINNYNDKDMMTDALSTQKFLADNYNSFASEAASPAFKADMMNILSEEHQMSFEIFGEMQKRGWYNVEQAEQCKIDKAKQKFTKGSQISFV